MRAGTPLISRERLGLVAAIGSLALLAGAFAFEHLGGLAPCKLCLWQRWPHALAVLAGGLVLAWRGWPPLALGAGLMAASAALGAYHTGIERGLWPGPASCSGGGAGLSGLSGADLLSLDAGPAVVLCDEVAWSLLGLSMASYNMLASLLLAGLWLGALAAPLSSGETRR